MAEALFKQDNEIIDWTADAAYDAGDVIQLPDGRAGVVTVDVASGELVGVRVRGIVTVTKTASMVVLPGSEMFWDHSADAAHLLHRNDRDFYLGVAMEDATSSATTCVVDLNEKPRYAASLADGFQSLIVQTAGFPYTQGNGDGAAVAFSATAEVQKADALGLRGVAPSGISIVNARINVLVSPDNAAADLNIGIANGTDASDADSITESLFIHIDGASLNINAESDDGTTEVNSTDTTVDYVAGTTFLAQWDLRNLADIQLYIDGVNVLPSSVFKLDAATGPMRPLLHMEKTSDDSPGNCRASIGIVAAQ